MTTWNDVSARSLAQVVDEAVSTALNGVAAQAGHGPLRWRVEPETNQLEGLAEAGTFAEDQIEPTVSGWATLLGLDQVGEPMAGTVEYRGLVGPHAVLIWGVTDRTTWEEN